MKNSLALYLFVNIVTILPLSVPLYKDCFLLLFTVQNIVTCYRSLYLFINIVTYYRWVNISIIVVTYYRPL